MATIRYSHHVAAPSKEVWDFVRDINNWAPLMVGYVSHKVISDSESLWTVRADTPLLSRTTELKVSISEWVELERVRFTVAGISEPFTGFGEFRLDDLTLTNNESGRDESPKPAGRLARWLFRRLTRTEGPTRHRSSGARDGTAFEFALTIEPQGMMRAMIDAAIQPLLTPAAEVFAERIGNAIEAGS